MARRSRRGSSADQLRVSGPHYRPNALDALLQPLLPFEETQGSTFPYHAVYPPGLHDAPRRRVLASGVTRGFVAHPVRRSSLLKLILGARRLPSHSGGERPLAVSKAALICVRRKRRREVLFALGRAGYRGSAPKRHYRRTADSYYRC